MKKFKIFMMMLALLLTLNACGTKITTEEAVNKAFAIDIESFDSTGKMDITVVANGQTMDQSMDMKMKYIKEPFITHFSLTTVDGDVEFYMDPDNVFVQMPGTEEWMKAPVDSIPDLSDLASGEAIQEQLERVKKFEELFKVEQSGNEYVLKVDVSDSSDEKEKELVLDVFKDALQQYDVSDLKINKFDYTLTLDKDFMLKSIVSKGDLDVTMEGETMSLKSDIREDYTDVNNVEEFTIPTEVTENAVDAGGMQ